MYEIRRERLGGKVLYIYAFQENFVDMRLDGSTEAAVRPELFRQMSLKLPVLTLDECRRYLMMPGACHVFTSAKNDDTLGKPIKIDVPELSSGQDAMLLDPVSVAKAVAFWSQIEEAYKKAGGGFGPLERVLWDFLRLADQKSYSVVVVSSLQTMEYE